MTPKSLDHILAAFLVMGSAQAAETPCDVRNLKGNYDFAGAGQIIPMIEKEPGKPSVYQYELRSEIVSGTITADEKGKASIQLTTTTEGFPPGSDKGEGTYSVNPDCTGKMIFSLAGEAGKAATTWSYDFLVEKEGKIRFVGASGNKLIAGQAWRAEVPVVAPPGKGAAGASH